MSAIRLACGLCICIGIAILACQKHGHVQQPIRGSTICDIATDPYKFDHGRVRVRARVASDGIENTVLVDQHCPHLAVALTWGDGRPTGDAAALVKALYGRPIGTKDKEIVATFVGTFVVNNEQRPVRQLIVTDVSGLTVKTRHGDSL